MKLTEEEAWEKQSRKEEKYDNLYEIENVACDDFWNCSELAEEFEDLK
jgi:hypothetical protein